MSNYGKDISVPSSQTAYLSLATPDVALGFLASRFAFTVEVAAAVVFVSFDGQNDHLKLTGQTVATPFYWPQQAANVWFKYSSGSTVTVYVSANNAPP